jgi:hypothetical protein
MHSPEQIMKNYRRLVLKRNKAQRVYNKTYRQKLPAKGLIRREWTIPVELVPQVTEFIKAKTLQLTMEKIFNAKPQETWPAN